MSFQITPEFLLEDVYESLTQEDPEKLAHSLGVIGRRGEMDAVTMGYGPHVAEKILDSNPEVAAAAIHALGNMGRVGAQFGRQIADVLKTGNETVRYAAAMSLGNFGRFSLPFSADLAAACADEEQTIRVVAAQSLGAIGADDQVDALVKLLDDEVQEVVGAACQALGDIGEAAEKYVDEISKGLDGERTRYAAVVALGRLGESAAKFADNIVDKCLTDADYFTRSYASTSLGKMSEAVLGTVSAEKIVELLKNEDPAVRCAAAMTFAYMGDKAVEHAAEIAALLKDDAEDESWAYMVMGGGFGRVPPASRKPKCAALVALGMMKASQYAKECAQHLDDECWDVRICALEAINEFGDAGKSTWGAFEDLLNDNVYVVRAKTCMVITSLKAEDHVRNVVPLLQDKSPRVKIAAAEALGELSDIGCEFSDELFKLLKEPIHGVRAAAVRALGNLGDTGKSYASVIAAMLEDMDVGVRCDAAIALGKLGDHGAAFAEEVACCLRDRAPPVRSAAAKALGKMGSEAEAYAGMLKGLEDDSYDWVGKSAKESLAALGM